MVAQLPAAITPLRGCRGAGRSESAQNEELTSKVASKKPDTAIINPSEVRAIRRKALCRKRLYTVDAVTVPFAPASYKVICGVPLLIFAALAFYWGSKNLRVCARMLQGKLPLPPKSSKPFVMIGVVFSLAALAAGAGATAFLLALETTQPTVVSEQGIRVGAGPLRYQDRFISWNEVTRVTCTMPARENRVRSMGLFTRDARVSLGNAGAALESVLAMAKQKTASGTVQPCKHVPLNHSWSY